MAVLVLRFRRVALADAVIMPLHLPQSAIVLQQSHAYVTYTLNNEAGISWRERKILSNFSKMPLWRTTGSKGRAPPCLRETAFHTHKFGSSGIEPSQLYILGCFITACEGASLICSFQDDQHPSPHLDNGEATTIRSWRHTDLNDYCPNDNRTEHEMSTVR